MRVARRQWLVGQIALSALLIGVLVKDFDWQGFFAILIRVSPAFYIWVLTALGFGQLLYALKWQLIVRSMALSVPTGELVRQFFISSFFNNFLPTNFGGDVARVFYLGQRVGYVSAGGS